MKIMKKKTPIWLSNPLYCVQIVELANGKYNVHLTVGSNRAGGGYNYEMNLPMVYKEMMKKWNAAGVVVTKKYIRAMEGLTFKTEAEAIAAAVRLEAAVIG